MKTKRVLVTEKAAAIIAQLKKTHGELMFHQSNIEGCDFHMSKDQFEYWKHTQLTIDVTPGRGSSFSLEIPLGIRFLIRSRLYSEEEAKHLEPIRIGA